MKRIQPFTIGTKLSVPSETKCLDYVDIIHPVEDLDCSELRIGLNDDIKSSSVHRGQGSTSSPVEGLSTEVKEDDERNSASPSGSSRFIRKIAMCTNAERHEDCYGIDSNETDCEGIKPGLSCEEFFLVEERRRAKSGAEAETYQRTTGMKTRNLRNDYSSSHDQAEDTAHSQRRELKDIENSLIQLTTSLDLMECSEEPERPHQKSSGAPGIETFPRDPSDKSWRKLKSLLRDHHQDLMLALDVSSFYQQADSIIGNVNIMRSCVLADELPKSDKETQEIACQINMLNECASRLSTLHPTLARRVTCKQAEVKENWALLQDFLRNQKTDVSFKRLSTLPTDPLTTIPDSQSFAGNEGQGVMGKDVKEEQNRLRGFECFRGLWTRRTWSPVQECFVGSRVLFSENSCSKLENISEKQDRTSCISQMAQTSLVSSQDLLTPESIKAPGMNEEHDWSEAGQDCKLEELLSQVEVLWEALQKKYEENSESDVKNKEQTGVKASQMVSELTLPNRPPESEEKGSSGMLEKFLALFDPSGYQRLSQDDSEPLAAEMSLKQLGCQTDNERSQEQDQTNGELQRLISTLTLRINQHLCRSAELSMDLLDVETSRAVLCDSDLSILEGLWEQQNDLEAHYNIIKGEVQEMERFASQMQTPPQEQERDPLREEVQAILQAWEEMGHSMAENKGRLKKFQEIQQYFQNYLAMITWTENTRSCMLIGSAAWRESKAAEIDCSIKTKLDEFSKLTAAAQGLMQEEGPFKDIIKERTDELQSMLGWIQVNWRAQKEQLERGENVGAERVDDPCQQQSHHVKNPSRSLCIFNEELNGSASETQECSFEQENASQDASSIKQESRITKTRLGSSICLILSFDEESSGINQVTKQWSTNNGEKHEAPTSNVQGGKEQSQKNLEIHQVTCPDSLLTNETKQTTSYEDLHLQNSYQEKETQSPGKKNDSNLMFSSIAESSNSTDKLEANLQLSTVTDHTSAMSQTDIPRQRMQKSVHNTKTNKCQSEDLEAAAEVTHRVCTYLHVSDSRKSPGQAIEDTSPSHEDIDALRYAKAQGEKGSCRNRFKASSLLKLKGPIKNKERVLHRTSPLGTIGLESSGNPSSFFRQRCNTWPERERIVKGRSRSNSKLQIFIRSSILPVNSVSGDKSKPLPEDTLPNVVKTSSGEAKNICSYLSLGSTLSFSLPRHFDNIALGLENNTENKKSQEFNVSNNQKAQVQEDSSTQVSEIDHSVHDLECTLQDETQLHVNAKPFKSVNQSKVFPSEGKSFNQITLCGTPCSCNHPCLSVYTKIKDLNGHLFYTPLRNPSVNVCPDRLSPGKKSRIINCGVQDCTVCFSEMVMDKPDIIMQELLQPGHWLFQQEEEELEDIWRGRLGNLSDKLNFDDKAFGKKKPLKVTD